MCNAVISSQIKFIVRHIFKTGHTAAHLSVTAIERVPPFGDEELLATRESLWINNYDSVEFGANTRR